MLPFDDDMSLPDQSLVFGDDRINTLITESDGGTGTSDGDTVMDVLAVDEIVEDAIKEPIASVSLPELTGTEGQQVVQERKERSCSLNKILGRFAREAHAVRGAEKSWKDPTFEISIEAPIEELFNRWSHICTPNERLKMRAM
ncbi:hypothetical protein KIN20_011559 [Parelaphostrongylus tenuis]|uniref:Uncharacterized protein n=1 Tax=Parelaphostrongylus tenuis TaxID=148309 RepID=A0AAD5MTS5_PARTN|nr:hypothetical protein KIN20_011559 [Parelaphostrongylus tenuis]